MPTNRISLPPGPVFLLQNLPVIVVPPATVFLVAQTLPRFEIVPPTWAVVLATFLSLPVMLTARILWKDFADQRAAEAHGAVLPPRVYSKWPGGISLLNKTVENLRSGYPGDLFAEWTHAHGFSWNFRALFENRFFTSEPEYIKATLATQFDSFEKGPMFNDQMRELLGTGVFNSDGEMWKFHRGMTRPFFSKDRISHFHIFDKHASESLTLLKTRLKEGFPVDIQDLASRFTMDSATEFLFGQNVHSLSAGIPHPHYSPLSKLTNHDHPANKFSRAFDEAQRLIAVRARLGANWPLAEFWKDKIKEQMLVVNAFIEPILRAAVEKHRASGGKTLSSLEQDREVEDGETLLDHLINYTQDEAVLRDEILNILLAGRDTTSNSITLAVYMLAEHPDVLKRLREEILEKVGETRQPTFDDMREMKYLRAVINETIRLYPAVPFNIRTTNKPVVLPGKYGGKPLYYPANSKAPYSIFLMQRRKDLWGPDALEFDPDRFIDDRLHKYITPNPFIFLPFNAGPRICLGQQFAYHETSFFLIRLLQQFSEISHVFDAQPPEHRPPAEWKGAEGTKGRDKIKLKTYITMSVAGGCWVSLKEAGSGDEKEPSV